MKFDDSRMPEAEFHKFADQTLADFWERIEAADREGRLEAEMQHGALTVDLPGGKQYLISKHLPMRQLWLASPVSGGLHFSYAGNHEWALPDGRKLETLVRQELQTLADIAL